MADSAVGKTCNHALEMLFAGIQAAGGAALAVYTYKNSANPIWSIAYSGVAIAGTCNVFKNVIKIFHKSSNNGRNDSCAECNVVTGTLIYFGSLYGLSEAWKCNHKLWIACLATAASGFCFAVSSMNSLKVSSALEPHSKFYQLAFEPALSVCGTIYLLYFRNHDEECLFWVPIFLTGATGLKIAISGFCRRAVTGEHTELLLKTSQIFMGGLLLTISSTVLAIYGSRKEFPLSWRAFMIVGGCIGVFKIFGSIVILMEYFDMEENIRSCFGGMITGHILFFSGCLMVKYMEPNTTAFLMFLFLTGCGHGTILASFYGLYILVPRPVFDRYCHRVFGPLLTLYSSAASAYIGYHMGWRFSLPTMAFVPVGVYIACKGFRRIDEFLREIFS